MEDLSRSASAESLETAAANPDQRIAPHLTRQHIIAYALGILTQAYRDDNVRYPVWEIWNLVRRVSLVVAVTFLQQHRSTMLSVAGLLNLIFLLVHIVMRPYPESRDEINIRADESEAATTHEDRCPCWKVNLHNYKTRALNVAETSFLFLLTCIAIVLSAFSTPYSDGVLAFYSVLVYLPAALFALWMLMWRAQNFSRKISTRSRRDLERNFSQKARSAADPLSGASFVPRPPSSLSTMSSEKASVELAKNDRAAQAPRDTEMDD
jgi:hypothetical protein